MPHALQAEFATVLRDPALPLPTSVISHTSRTPQKRFAVYRNNVMVGLIGALESRFPATRRIVGDEFFAAAARVFASTQPPRSPLMMTYGDEFPDFLASFEPAAEIAYLADVAGLEAARTRAYHAADAAPLEPAAFSQIDADRLADLCIVLHPSVEIIRSQFPIVVIWAMNAGDMELGPVADWRGDDALVARPALDVEVRRLPPGAAAFLQSLSADAPLGTAAESAAASDPAFDLAVNLAALFSAGLAISATHRP
ncbi:DNA-binding domain-containing protein [Methylocapsa acidiphila]|uniref:HvfC/BufC N-terminal domain-containing protein n=1 Tax=Methylocapsa acidiphila TaxID=133552 RepID=UPI0004107556|nr:DNA-binding domain-containing protein [Methylocapsa acidiphila]